MRATSEQRNGTLTPTSTATIVWNKLEIITDVSNSHSGNSFQQFDIIQNDALVDWLFYALVDFLRIWKINFSNIPCNVNEPRLNAVNYILSKNSEELQLHYERFRASLITNLRNQIANLSQCNDDNIKNAYSNYMSTPGNYGTTVELCAIAELFNFGFIVIQENTEVSGTDEVKQVAYLFTGDTNDGHFQLLDPTDFRQGSCVVQGAYKLVKDYTTSRMKSISQTRVAEKPPGDCINAKSHLYDAKSHSSNIGSSISSDQVLFNRVTCNSCGFLAKNERGLKLHARTHNNQPQAPALNGPHRFDYDDLNDPASQDHSKISSHNCLSGINESRRNCCLQE